jgi:hypothetical protein
VLLKSRSRSISVIVSQVTPALPAPPEGLSSYNIASRQDNYREIARLVAVLVASSGTDHTG